MRTCKWCGAPLELIKGEECRACWELRWRIESLPEIATLILQNLRDCEFWDNHRKWARGQDT